MSNDTKDDQGSSDPLPYTQVDRAVKQTAAVIGEMLGVPFQHAVGGLVQFWESNGDVRELEALLAAGRREVVLPGDEVARRFKLAMGVDTSRIDPDDLVSLRLLERRPDGYRVRGMSRYFKPLQHRAQARLAASAGGKASARVRSERFGTAQPRSGAASGPASESASRWSRSAPEAGVEAGVEADTEAAPNTAVSGQRSSEKAFPASPVTQLKKPRQKSRQQLVFDQLAEARHRRLGEGWSPDDYAVEAINSFLKHVVDLKHPDTGEGLSEQAITGAFDEFLADGWAATLTPPFAISAFASKRKFSECLSKYLARPVERAS